MSVQEKNPTSLPLRDFLRLGVLIGAASILDACGLSGNSNTSAEPSRPTPRATLVVPGQSEQAQLIRQEITQTVRRLAQYYPEGSPVRTIYSPLAPTSLSPVFQTPVEISYTTDRGPYARAILTSPKYSKDARFRYTLNRDNLSVKYQTLVSLGLRVQFSADWYLAKTEAVKRLMAAKEANTIAQFEQYAKIVAWGIYTSQGIIESIDPTVTHVEVARTLAVLTFDQNPQLITLFDYAGYLTVLPEAKRIMDGTDAVAKAELSVSNIPKVLDLAEDARINYSNIEFNSPEFFGLAYGNNSPWKKLILSDPSLLRPTRQP